MTIWRRTRMAIGYAVSAALLGAALSQVPWSTVATTLGLREATPDKVAVAIYPVAPGPRDPAVDSPAADSPADEGPAVESPDVESPAADSPAADSPAPAAVEPDGPWRGTLRVRAWGREFKVKDVPLLDNGELVPPDNILTVGRWDRGARPGSGTGTVVLVVHRDCNEQGRGPFADLEQLPIGARVTLGGQTYRLEQLATYAKNDGLPSEKLFSQSGPERLVIVTCGGTFTRTAIGWDSNIVATFRLDTA